MVVCEYQLQKRRAELIANNNSNNNNNNNNNNNSTTLPATSEGVHSSIQNDVKSILKGKNLSELETLQQQITETIESGNAFDVEYWEALLKSLRIYKSKAQLRELHAQLLEETNRRRRKAEDDRLTKQRVETMSNNNNTTKNNNNNDDKEE